MSSMYETVLIIGLTPQGLSLLRTLCKANVRVIAFYNGKKNIGRYSKYGAKYFFEDIEQLKNHINNYVAQVDYKPLCYITSGEMLAWILREFKELYELCNVVSGPIEVVERLAHKDVMYELAIKNGFNVAKYRTLDKYEEGDLKFPIFLKRNYEIPLFFKAERIDCQEKLRYFMNRINASDFKDVIAQEFIDIPYDCLVEISVQLFCSNGLVKGSLICNQKRRLKKGLTSYLEEISDSSLKEYINGLCVAFVADLKYTGFIEFEFMCNSKTGELFFIETNTRTCGLQSSLDHKFANLPEAIICPYNAPMLIEKCSNLKWMNIARDIRVRIERKSLADICDIFKSKFDILDWNDPIPFFRQFIR